jgi:hypothetical protein
VKLSLTAALAVTACACVAPPAGAQGLGDDYSEFGQPVARVVPKPPSAFVGQIVTFDGSGSSDSDGPKSALRYRWDTDNNGTFEIDTGSDSALPFTSFVPGPNTVGMQVSDADPISAHDRATATATFMAKPGAVVDTTPPVVRLSRISRSLRRALRRRSVVVRLRCSEACTMAATIGSTDGPGVAWVSEAASGPWAGHSEPSSARAPSGWCSS